MTFRFSRSHQEAYHTCPRLAWLRYYDRGHGWESTKLDLHRATGSLVHSINQWLLNHCLDHDTLPNDEVVDLAVAYAIEAYKKEAQERGVNIEEMGDLLFELTRQSALAEALCRAWVRVRLPDILAKFKVIAVEQEWDVPLDPEGTICIMVRLDALLERRDDKDLWVLEEKTTGWMSEDWLESFRYSSQTLQQVWAVERHMKRACGGVLVEALYKGIKRSDESGKVTYYSPLIRGYIKKGIPPFDEDELSWDSANARRKGWEPCDVWQWGKTKDWVALLPTEVLTAQLFSREVFRSGSEQEQWARQTLAEQRRLSGAVASLADPGHADIHDAIMALDFPARLNADCYSNKYRQRCPMLQVCFSGLDPADSEEFRPREPHHTQERDD